MESETKCSRMDQIKFVQARRQKFEKIWAVSTDHINANFLKAVF